VLNLASVIAACLVGSSTYIGAIPISLATALLVLTVLDRRCFVVEWNIYYSITSLLFVIGFMVTAFSLIFDSSVQDESGVVLMALRKACIEFYCAFVVFFYLNGKTYGYIVKVLLLSFFVNSTIGWIQFFYFDFARVSMLFVEPSSAGYFICCFLFLAMAELDRTGGSVFLKWYIFLASLLVASKAQYLIYGVYFVLRRKAVLAIMVGFGGVFFASLHQYLGEISGQYKGFILMVNALNNIDGSNIFNMYSTYSTRFVSVYIAFQEVLANPLGMAFGEFNFIFKEKFDLYVPSVNLSDEMMFILSDAGFASPKSRLLELLLTTGWAGVLGVVFFSYRFTRDSCKSNNPLFLSFLFFLISSFLVELNNIYLYLFVFSLLISKSRERDNLVTLRNN